MLFLFKSNGVFKKQIGSWGRGLGEYGYINDFCIDSKNRKLYILDAGEVLEYNFNGDFTRKFFVPRYSSNYLMTGAGKFILYQFNLPLDSIDRKYSWYITDLDGNIKEAIYNSLKRTKTPGILIRKMPLYNFNNKINFTEFGSDTLFQLRDYRPEPYAIFNFGKVKMPYDFYLPPLGEREILKKYLWLSSVKEDNQYIFFGASLGISDSSRYGIFNKDTFETAFIKNNCFINDVDEGPSFWPDRIFNDTLLVSWIEGFKLLEFINRKLADKSGFKDNSNRKKF